MPSCYRYVLRSSVFSFFFVSTLVFATAQHLPELHHYIDSTGNIYWPKSKPVYLFASDEDSGENAEMLDSKKTADVANPMYLANEGLNYIRSLWAVKDGKTVLPKQEVLFEIYADGLAPETSVSFFANAYKNKGTQYYQAPLKISSVSTDQTSGVKSIFYSINDEPFEKYSDTISITKEMSYAVSVQAIDMVNNPEELQSFAFEIDNTAPATEYQLEGTFRGKIFAPDLNISFTSEDQGSGVAATYFELDSLSKTKYTQPLTMKGLEDGLHTLRYYAKDHVTNEESAQLLAFYLDKTPPTVQVNIVGDQYQNRGRVFISDRTNVEFTASDNKSGIKKIVYTVDDGEEKIYKGQFALEKSQGDHVIKYYAVDKVGNGLHGEFRESYGGRKGLDIDMEAPVMSHSFNGAIWESRDTIFITPSTKIDIAATDNDSGVKKIGFKINGGSGVTYEAPFNIEEAGHFIIDYYATDFVNNRNSKDFHFVVDDAAPTIDYQFSAKSAYSHELEGAKIPVFAVGTSLYLFAQDAKTNTKSITYSINGQDERIYSSPIKVATAGLNTIKVSAEDVLGNTSDEITITIWVE